MSNEKIEVRFVRRQSAYPTCLLTHQLGQALGGDTPSRYALV